MDTEKYAASLFLFLVWAAFYINNVNSFPSGAPSFACDDMIPQHGSGDQSSPSPYALRISANSYAPGQTLTVTLSGSPNFRGFLVQARSVTDPDNRLGTFDDSALNQVATCDGAGITHSGRDGKSSVTLRWIAPSTFAGNIRFRATIVQEFSTFWLEVYSDVVTDEPLATTTISTITTFSPTTTIPTIEAEIPSSTTTTQTTTEIDLSSCGREKGCFRYPEDCDIDTCTTVATWTPVEGDETSVLFEMQGRNVGWVALGFSNDEMMGEDYVLMCARSGGSASIKSTYNVATFFRRNVPFDNESFGIRQSVASYEDGILRCVFRREISTSTLPGSRRRKREDADQFFDIRDPYTLFLGYGPVIGGRPALHSEIPHVSGSEIRVVQEIMNLGTSEPQPTSSPRTRVASWLLSLIHRFLAYFGFRI